MWFFSFRFRGYVNPVVESVPLVLLYISLHLFPPSVFHPNIHIHTAIRLLLHTHFLSHIHWSTRLSTYHPFLTHPLSRFLSPTRSYAYVRILTHSLTHIQPPNIWNKWQATLKWKLLMLKRIINFEYNGSILWKLFNIFSVKYLKI